MGLEGGGVVGKKGLAALPALTGKQLLGGRWWDEREGAMESQAEGREG